jgi:plastocyanin
VRTRRAAALAVVVLLGASAACGRAARSHTIEISGFAYDPARLEVAPGDTVVWINRDAVPHTATREGGGWDSRSLASQSEWRFVVTRDDGGPYFCTFHPTMRGTLGVRAR